MQATNQNWMRVYPGGYCDMTHLYRIRTTDIGGGAAIIATDIENALVLAASIINTYAHLPMSSRVAHLERPLKEALETYTQMNQSSM